jgi:hypothetical protein
MLSEIFHSEIKMFKVATIILLRTHSVWSKTMKVLNGTPNVENKIQKTLYKNLYKILYFLLWFIFYIQNTIQILILDKLIYDKTFLLTVARFQSPYRLTLWYNKCLHEQFPGIYSWRR